jgi:putative transposase
MAGKFLCVYLHMVWSTKERRALNNPQWAGRLHSYLGSIACAKKATLIEVNSEPDHIHLLSSLPSTVTIADMVNAYKSNSSRWISDTFGKRNWHSWQEGYAAFSVSRSQKQAVMNYIRNQQEHHKKHDFKQELLELLDRHEIEYDLRYVFD